jgi:2-C-methyl-D-erythritol 4-phosphate cytidylyltransferase
MAKFGVIVFTAAPDASSPAGGGFIKVDGRESLLRAVELFVNREQVAQIVVGFNPGDGEKAKEKFGSHFMIMGFAATSGGPALRDQLKACATKLPPDVTHVIVHDAARPAVSPADIDALFEAAEKHTAVALVTSVGGPIVRIDESGALTDPMPEKSLRHLVWPRAFSKAAFDELVAKGPDALLSRLEPLDSSPCNVRVNDARDAGWAKSMIGLLPKAKSRASTNPFDEAQW